MKRSSASKPSGVCIDVAHPCWTGVEDDFDHEFEIEEYEQGDPSTPYFQVTHYRVCVVCGEVDEDWDGSDDSWEDTYVEDSYAR